MTSLFSRTLPTNAARVLMNHYLGQKMQQAFAKLGLLPLKLATAQTIVGGARIYCGLSAFSTTAQAARCGTTTVTLSPTA